MSRAYSRESELEADAFARSLIGACGGEVVAGERLLAKLAPQPSGQGTTTWSEYLATHPPLAERITHLKSGRK